MKIVAFLFCCLFVAEASVMQTREAKIWEDFKSKHNRAYKSEDEHNMRWKIFLENLKTINEHNKKYEQGESSFKMGVNEFADMLYSEFADTMLTRPQELNQEAVEVVAVPKAGDVPDSMDWRERGAVSSVKDQGHCGGCWSFASTGALEAYTFLKTGSLVELSQQNLIDCALDGNSGCDGGLEYNGWTYVKNNGGIDTAEAYPYEAKQGTCRYDPNHIGATCTGYKRLAKGDENAMKVTVGTIGPVSVGIDAEQSFQFYTGGVMKANDCSKYRLNHSVLVVGYGTENGEDYWLVKNSFGAHFGEDGYIKMARNNDNMCGIASDMSYPTV